MRTTLVSAALAAMCLLPIPGTPVPYAQSDGSAPSESAKAPGEATAIEARVADGPIRVAFVTNNASDFWTIAEAGTQKAGEDLGVDVLFRIPSTGTAEQQQQILQDLVTAGVSGIAISPKDPVNQTDMLNRAAASANLITQDSDAPESNRICYVGTDNVEAGRKAAELVAECTPPSKPIVVCVGSLDAQNAKDRLRGLEEAFEDTGHTVVDVRTDEADRAKALANVEDTLIRRPDVGCFVGLWSYNGPAILNGVRSAGRQPGGPNGVQIVCFDEEQETLQGVADGEIYGTVVQQPYQFGYRSVEVLTALANGDASVVPENRQIVVPVLQLRVDTAADFRNELDALLGR